MESDESVKETPLSTAALQNRQVIGRDWAGLKEALVSSLTSGTFLDFQFYPVETRSSTGSPKIRPIYFCSGVGESFVSKLVTCKFLALDLCRRVGDPKPQMPQNSKHGRRYLFNVQTCMAVILRMKIPTRRAPKSPTLRRGGSSVYPRFSTRNLFYSSSVQECPTVASSETEPALLLKSGAAKTQAIFQRQCILLIPRCSWGAIFLYMYTRKIAFATLGSQCAAPSAGGLLGCSQREVNPSQGPERLRTSRSNAVAVETGSPKSIHSPANEVCLTPLRSGAVTDSPFI